VMIRLGWCFYQDTAIHKKKKDDGTTGAHECGDSGNGEGRGSNTASPSSGMWMAEEISLCALMVVVVLQDCWMTDL